MNRSAKMSGVNSTRPGSQSSASEADQTQHVANKFDRKFNIGSVEGTATAIQGTVDAGADKMNRTGSETYSINVAKGDAIAHQGDLSLAALNIIYGSRNARIAAQTQAQPAQAVNKLGGNRPPTPPYND